MKNNLFLKTFQIIAMLSIVLIFLFTGIGLQSANATSRSDTEVYAAVDAYIKDQMKTYKIPGAALAIVRGDQVDYLQSYGIADPTGRAVTPQTPFMLASLSKSFTALAIMQLVEKGKLDLDSSVQKYLPWFHVADEKASTEITVRQLLNQTSGFSETNGNQLNMDTNMADDALIASMKRLNSTKLINTPGAAFEYSNINYGLLGAIVETVSGQSFETYIQQNIFDPLEMKHSFASLSAARAGGATNGYSSIFGIPIVYDNFMPYSRAVTPWAGIFSSAEDMAHYLIAHMNGGKYQGKSVISSAGMAALHQPGVQIDKWYGYAMGWWIGPDFDIASQDKNAEMNSYTIPIAVFHEGTWANFRTVAIMVPQEKIGIVLLMNADDIAVESAFGSIAWDTLLIYDGKQPNYPPPSEDFIRQHARFIFVGVNLLLLASLIWFIRKIRNWRQQPANMPGRVRLIGYVAIPLFIDAAIAWYLLAEELPQSKATVLVTLRTTPDIGMLLVLVLLFTIGWGTIRTLWLLLTVRANSSLKWQ